MQELATWFDESSFGTYFLRLSLAVLLGGLLGYNRERADKPAGLRTHMMVALGAALFTVLSFEASEASGGDDSALRLDPFRSVQGIIGGLGFLGAGSIIRDDGGGIGSKATVSGLTTAASIWLTGALGVAAGMGAYAVASVTALMALLVLGMSRFVDRQ